jgi:lipopolysaccharide/colanic/teichoic acid biosynthesis glycosyltransferase
MPSPADVNLPVPIPIWKRLLDVTCCVIALPFLALAACWAFFITSITSRGPIFFRQERVGYMGRRFLLYKFRTMHVTASVSDHQVHFSRLMTSNEPMQKLDARGDRRLIPGGWLLRASGLDELPQIINVLRGEMSIVGPRPCIPYEYERYSLWQRDRLRSVPGLTGLWQVSGKNQTTFDEMVSLDIAYAKQLSFASDLGIIFKTIPALVTQVSDTRKARKSGGMMPVQAAANAPGEMQSSPATGGEEGGLSATAVSATFLTRSQNVIAGTRVEEHRDVSTRQSRETCVSFKSGSESDSIGPRLVQPRPPA